MWPEKVTFNIYKSTTYSPKYLCLLFDMKISMKVLLPTSNPVLRLFLGKIQKPSAGIVHDHLTKELDMHVFFSQ